MHYILLPKGMCSELCDLIKFGKISDILSKSHSVVDFDFFVR